jgi:UDPglucose 6-dehydrogenase
LITGDPLNIAIVGTGYVGLVAGVCFAETGHQVFCVDIDEAKVSKLSQGEVPIYEPGLSDMMRHNLAAGRLHFTTSLSEVMGQVEIVFIAVGTPMGQDGSADVQYVLKVAEEIGKSMSSYKVVVDKSTVPVGTADKVSAEIKKYTDLPFDVVSNPEFLKEGAAIDDFMKPDRIVIGCDSEKAENAMRKLYDPFVRTGAPIYAMDVKSAELTKYVSNAMLATKISFMNEMACLADSVGANINKVRKAVGADRRIGHSFLFPGVGYGGSCFPKDVNAIEKIGVAKGLSMDIMKAVTQVNEKQKSYMCAKMDEAFAGDLKGKRIAMWGLSFKPKTDDMREAPSLVMSEFLLERGASICAFDPQAMEVTQKHYLGDRIDYAKSVYDAVKDADALILVTEWSEFRSIDFDKLKSAMNGLHIFDGRNIYDRKEVESHGFIYTGVGC